MSPLELLRYEQQQEAITASDVELMQFLGAMTVDRVQREIADGLTRDERALYRFHRGGTA